MKGAEGKPQTAHVSSPQEMRSEPVPTPHTVNLEALQNLVAGFTEVVKSNDDPSELSRRELFHVIERTNDFLAKGLRAFGISPDRTFKSLLLADKKLEDWDDYTIRAPIPRYALANVRRMLALERKVPGIVRYLYEQRGIRNFARYTIDFWLRQFAEKDSALPYMLVVVPSSLENDTLPETAVYTDLQQNLKKLAHPHLMRMIEIYDVPDALNLLTGLNKTYNKKNENPITVLLFDGHGDSERVFLRPGGKGGLFGTEHLRSARFQELFTRYLSTMFTPTAQFIFGSCESAQSEDGLLGVAHELKDVLRETFSKRVRVVGSEEMLTAFSELKPSLRKDGSLSLACQTTPYGEGDSPWSWRRKARVRRPRLKHL